MKYVLDASVALKWVLVEPDSTAAAVLRDEFVHGMHDFVAPDVFVVEIAHALAKAERRGIVAAPQGELLLANLLATAPRLYANLPLLQRAFSIASAARISLYDCLYVALAEREKCELLTADTRLISVLQKQFPFIIPLTSLR